MTEELHLTGEDLSLFGEVITSFHRILDLDEMLTVLFTRIKPLFAIEGASIALHDAASREFYFYRTIEQVDTPRKSALTGFRFPDHLGIAGWVKEHDETVVINDVAADPRVLNIDRHDTDFTTRSMICVPLRCRKGFIGIFYALNKIDGTFTERDRKLLEILSQTIAVSLENARLYGELTDHLQALERDKRRLLSQVQERTGFGQIIGSSPPMRRLFDLMEKVIGTPTSVLIQGETGTGKELIARVIHFNGPLRDKPFIAENCGALPEALLESELFGHVRGAFTGAVADKKGLFEMADGGTIFLDEIGEMSMPMQVKLLRVLQEGQFRPVGGNRTVQVQVRLIASTNRDLAEECRHGRFREDLFYRINVFQITAPPLRQRKDDILGLASHFLARICARFDRPIPQITPTALDLLMRYDWPGNVRELENEMERAVTMAAGGPLLEPHLLSGKLQPPGAEPAAALNTQAGTLKEAVQALERHLIQQAMARAQGNRSLAARSLGLSRQGLLNKLAAFAIEYQ